MHCVCPQNGKEYAIAYSDKHGEVPVNFKANKNGEYTLTVSATLTTNLSPLTSNLSTLTLIDNLTGANVDLLTTPSYTFTAKTTDYESRFKLVFNANGDADCDYDAPFAFINDGHLIVTDEGTLQIFDILGHLLYAKQASLTTNLSTLTSPGVYVLRLIDGENVKVQKIVVEK